MSETARSRTEYSARNTSVAVASRLSAIFMGFLVRIVFTHTLSEDYVGVNGLFLDIINILSLTELGVGAAITYALYQPIERGDIEKQKSLMKLFRNFYHLVAVIVAGAGLLVIPFMDVLIKDPPNVEHLTFIYLLYLTNSVSSYLLIYKKTLIDAHQLAYIGTLYQTVSWMVQDVIQIVVLLTTHNFILYLLLNLAATVISNVLISRHADRLYPFLKDREVAPLPDVERRGIFKNVRAMLLHKIGGVMVTNTDNLIISAFVGIVSAGRYSNYYLVTVSIKQVIEQFFQGIMASVGNLGVSEKPERIRRIFRATFFICQWLCCFSTIAFLELLDLFVGISFGTNYIFSRDVTIMICLSFYVTGMRYATIAFRDSLGIFYYDRYKAIFEAVFNLVFSIIFAQWWGTAGVFLGTVVSTVLTSTWVEPYVLYKHRLKVPVWEYFGRYAVYVAVALLCWFATDRLCGLAERAVFGAGAAGVSGAAAISGAVALGAAGGANDAAIAAGASAWGVLLIRAVICLVVPNVIMLAVYFRFWEFKLLVKKARFLLAKRGIRLPFEGVEAEAAAVDKGADVGASGDTSAVGDAEVGDDADGLSLAERLYLDMMAYAVRGVPLDRDRIVAANDTDWRRVLDIGSEQNQLPLLHAPLAEAREILLAQVGGENAVGGGAEDSGGADGAATPALRQELIDYVSRASQGFIIADYYLWHETGVLHRALSDAGIRSVVMKGPTIAKYYPTPELRKSGDIDLWLPDVNERGNATDDNFGEIFDRAREVLAGYGYEKSEVQGNMHHTAFTKGDGPEVELHGRLTEIFDDERMNERIFDFQREAVGHLQETELFTGARFTALSEADAGFYMILHTLQHYTTKGFGWKFVCDWSAYLAGGKDAETEERLYALLEKSGLLTFTGTLTRIAMRYVGLTEGEAEFLIRNDNGAGRAAEDALVRELFDAGEFGLADENRMVVLRDAGLVGLVREFHHQMRHNHPEASRHIWKWPYLWLVTLWEFYRNNHRLRGVRSRDVIKSARQRAALVRELRLFRE